LETAIRRRRRRKFTDKMAHELPVRRKAYFEPDPEMPNHGTRVQPSGSRAFYVLCRDAFKKQRWVRLGSTAEMTIEQSRDKARNVIRRLREGLEPHETPAPKPDSVADVTETYFKRFVERRGLRSARE